MSINNLTGGARDFVLLWLPYLLLSFGMWKLSGKLGSERRWLAWIPGARFAALGRSRERK